MIQHVESVCLSMANQSRVTFDQRLKLGVVRKIVKKLQLLSLVRNVTNASCISGGGGPFQPLLRKKRLSNGGTFFPLSIMDDGTIAQGQASLTVFFAIPPLPNVGGAIAVGQDAFAMFLVAFPFSLVLATISIRPTKLSMPEFLAIDKAAVINVTVCIPQTSLTVAQTTTIMPGIEISFLGPAFSKPVLIFAVIPEPIVARPIQACMIGPLPHVLGTIIVPEFAFALALSTDELSVVLRAVGTSVYPVAMT